MIYLDNAATSYPKPQNVLDILQKCLLEWGGNPGRSGHKLSIAASEIVYRARCALSDLIEAEGPEHIVFTLNATYAINIMLRAVLKRGDHVLISDMEHNAVLRPVHHMAKTGMISYTIFPHQGNVTDTLHHLVTPKTKLVVITHVSNVTGETMPVESICSFAKSHNILTFVDASQSLGHIPLKVSQTPCDFLCAPSHKGLLGIQGAGALYLRNFEGVCDVFQGGSGTDSLRRDMPDFFPDRLEAGTLPTPAIATMCAGIEWIRAQGLPHIERHIAICQSRLFDALSDMKKVKVYSPRGAPILSFAHETISSDKVSCALDDMEICTRGGFHCAKLAHQTLGTADMGVVRISPGPFTTQKELSVTIDCIYRIIKSRQ